MSLVIPMVIFIQQRMAEVGNADNAKAMQAYMKTEQDFYGVKAPERKAIFKQAREHTQITSFIEYKRLVLWLWSGENREEQYLAMDAAEYYTSFRTLEAFPVYEEMLTEASHWDTVDKISSNLIGPLVKEHRELEDVVRGWRQSDNMWLRRASLLIHLKHKKETNLSLLEETILMLAGEQEFFIRKAIGWVLREYAKTDAEYVKSFVQRYQEQLSPLSQKEALKNL
ncbi:DNA alkylation repair protein [Photobacterium sp. DNB23_23_1]|uniref:DNA alkylation repair protein n=1 Tax=Photobacterium pectinilyticum TaxID=2906793 RepID=A0ABT1N7X4_9GAMM|nr:DNA alkylation repair protein [Photobacterium sp. ZSDE20]MCQ1059771.1 DNA alkylation repair protein [Photobacterium sp. ZSDE20]MDD1826006.1 DNA alkylation repair protein [Photobacterium sp. ZSDE20]